MARLVIHSGARKGEEIKLERGSNRLGRAEGNDIVLDDPSISKLHCEIVVGDMSVQVRDLNSSNGTCIEGRRIQCAAIRTGQILMVGSTALRLEDGPVDIVIPHLSRDEEPKASVLADGTPACLYHAEVPASFQCRQCGKTYCASCVHDLHLAGGKPRLFCPVCSGACVSLAMQAPPRPASIASRLIERIRRPFRRTRR
ncbi:MAG TPA: FHA domain-containing protein [Verrucomicrobiota bacterium]|nr:FHA domain-containing protein [Verrucomicrobiota bacterium]HRZ38443.1 FHA domain-containing protein [Candidatus Paceibacterota bacterium]